MEDRSYALLAGTFVIVLAAALVAVMVWLGGDRIERVQYVVVSTVPVSGLTVQAPVRLRGVDVGNVQSIRFDPEDPRRILVSIAVDRAAPVTQGTYAQLGYWGISGLTLLQLSHEGTSFDRLQPGARIDMRPSLLGQAADAAELLIANANRAAERVTELLSDKNLGHISRSLAELERAIAGVREARAAIQGELTQNTLPKYNALAEELTRQARRLDRLLTELQERPQSLIFGRGEPPPGPGEPGFEQRRQGSP